MSWQSSTQAAVSVSLTNPPRHSYSARTLNAFGIRPAAYFHTPLMDAKKAFATVGLTKVFRKTTKEKKRKAQENKGEGRVLDQKGRLTAKFPLLLHHSFVLSGRNRDAKRNWQQQPKRGNNQNPEAYRRARADHSSSHTSTTKIADGRPRKLENVLLYSTTI